MGMKDTKGFTLIELLVVIAIIALLLSIVLPGLRAAKNQAQSIVCLSNLNGIAKAWAVYASENNAEIVGGNIGTTGAPYYCWVGNPRNGSDQEITSNFNYEDEIRGIKKGLLYAYIGNVDNYKCPTDKRHLSPPATSTAYSTDGGYRTYSIVGGARGATYNAATRTYVATNWNFEAITKTTSLKNPGTKYIFVEENDGRGMNLGSWIVNPTNYNQWVDAPSVWHADRNTLGFADGHVEKHRWNEKSTYDAAKDGRAYIDAPGSQDLAYMIRGYPYLRIVP